MSNLIRIEISEEDWNELVEARYYMQALEAAGVDSWEGADEAHEIFQEIVEEDPDNLLKYSTFSNTTIH